MKSIHYFAKLGGSVIFAAAVLSAPWVFRANLTNAEESIYAGFLIVASLALVALFTTPSFSRRNYSFARLTVASLPLLGGILLGIIQIVPFPNGLYRYLSPEIEDLTAELLPLPGTEDAEWEDQILPPKERRSVPTFWPSTVSVYVQKTRENLAVLTLAFLAFSSGGILFQTNRSRLFFWRIVALNGILLALFVIMTKSIGDASLYRRLWPTALCGPFVNRNSMAGYLCLCLGPAIGLLMREILFGIRRRDEEEIVYDGIRYDGHRSVSERLLDRLSDFLNLFSRSVSIWLGIIGILLAGIAVTFSRGGTLAALFSFSLAVLLFAGRKKAGLYLIPIWTALLLGLFFIFWMGMTEPVQKRMGTLFSSEEQQSAVITNGRLENWMGALKSTQNYRWRGSGLGTYALANRANDKALYDNHYFCFAENQAVETMLTAGIPGLILLFGELILFWFFAFKALGRRKIDAADGTEENLEAKRLSDIAFVFGIGMAAVLSGQMISGSFDFGLFFYPNAVLLAALCGSFAGGRLRSDDSADSVPLYWSDEDVETEKWVYPVVFSLFMLLTLGLGIFGYRETVLKGESERLNARYQIDIHPEQLDSRFLDKALADFSDAVEKRPNDASLHYQLARTHIIRFRFAFWQNLKKEVPDADPIELWNRTSPDAIYGFLHPFIRSRMTVVPRRFRRDPAVTEHLVPAMKELFIVRRLCPLFPESHLDAAFLLPIVSDLKETDALVQTFVRRGVEVSPNEPIVLFSAGAVRFLSADRDEACRNWARSLSISGDHFEEIVLFLSTERTKAEFCRRLRSVVGDRLDLVNRGIERYPKKTDPVTFDVFLTVMGKILDDAPEKTSGEYYRNRAHFERLSERYADAADSYKKALAEDPFNARWFYEYGTLLYNQKNADESIAAFTKAAELNPKSKTYENALRRAEQFKRQQIFDAFK